MRNGIAQAAARLGAQFPDWETWWVPKAVGRPVVLWCARPWDDEKQVIHADSAEELDERLAKLEAER